MRKSGRELLDTEKSKKDNYFTKLGLSNANSNFLKKSMHQTIGLSSTSVPKGNIEDPF